MNDKIVWLAVDENGLCGMHTEIPHRIKYYPNGDKSKSIGMWESNNDYTMVTKSFLPDLSWENEPIKAVFKFA